MPSVKSLFKDTAIYGVSSIVGRFLNWCLVPMYTYCFPSAEYGIVTNLYAYVALVLVILIYGMETGFFRFANHERYSDPGQVYTTSLISLGTTSALFIVAGCLLSPQLAGLLDCGAHPAYIWMMVVAVGADAFTSIPFAYLRYRHRPMRFASLKLVNIGLNIGLNLFFILLCPWLWRVAPESIGWFYDPGFGIGYIFLANMISSLAVLALLLPELTAERYSFNGELLRRMLSYSFPLLIIGIAGIMNQTIDKILFPMIYPDRATAMTELGIYGANYKIAIVMVMFIQAFRFAYEPFIFAQSREKGEDRNIAYRQAMTWFVIAAMFIFIGVVFFLPVLKYFISGLFLGPEGGAGDYDGGVFLRHILQPFAVVQANRPHRLGHMVHTAGARRHRGAQLPAGATHGVHGVCRGCAVLLRGDDAGIVFHRQGEISDRLRCAPHSVLHRGRHGALGRGVAADYRRESV